MIAALSLLMASLLPQGQEPVFVVADRVSESGGTTTTISGDRRSISCLEALQQLTATMGWNVHVESKPLENDLQFSSVNLAFTGQDPLVVAQLIAVAGGGDVVFDAGQPAAGMRPVLHVTRKPDGATESGRQRLRGMAGDWYRSFLQDELQNEPLVEDEAMRVRMNLGRLLVENGELERALPLFAEVYEHRPGVHVPTALLRLAQTSNDLAATTRDKDQAKKRFEQAESWCRKLLELYPSSPEATGATVALGRSLLGQASVAPDQNRMRDLCDRCRTELAARVMRLNDTVEMCDVWLLVGEAQFRLEWASRVYETMLTLRESPNFGDLDDRQFRDYHFLLGYGALGSQKAELAMQSFEWFLIHSEGDPRRAFAHVMLADAYMQLGRYVEARAAALTVRKQYMAELEPRWRTRALQLYARTGLAIGDKENAYQELEVLVHRQDDPDLVLFLADQLIEDRQWQRAISVTRILQNRPGKQGDLARFKAVQALYEQAKASKSLAEFPALARELAPKIEDRDLRSQCAELIGDAYTQIGQLEAAADAYRGILR